MWGRRKPKVKTPQTNANLNIRVHNKDQVGPLEACRQLEQRFFKQQFLQQNHVTKDAWFSSTVPVGTSGGHASPICFAQVSWGSQLIAYLQTVNKYKQFLTCGA